MNQDLIRLIRQEIRSIVDPMLLRDRVFMYGSPTGQTIALERLPPAVTENRPVIECVADHAVATGRVVVPVGLSVQNDVVRLRVRYAQPNPADACRILGITKQAAGVNDIVPVITSGMIRNGVVFSFTNAPTRVFLGTDGSIQEIAPTAGVVYIIGHAPSADTVIFDPAACVVLSS